MTTKKKPRAKPNPRPEKTAGNGVRNPVTGQFLPGHPGGPGRPRGLDFRALVAAHRGDTLPAAMVDLFDALMLRARNGDVQAAKLLLDRLCDAQGKDGTLAESFDVLLRRAMGLEPKTEGG